MKSSQTLSKGKASYTAHEPSTMDVPPSHPTMFDKAGTYSNRSPPPDNRARGGITIKSGQFKSQKNLSRRNESKEFNQLHRSANNASQVIVTQAERARDLAKSRKVVEEYLSDVKKRTMTMSTRTGTNFDHKISYKSLPPVNGVETEKNI